MTLKRFWRSLGLTKRSRFHRVYDRIEDQAMEGAEDVYLSLSDSRELLNAPPHWPLFTDDAKLLTAFGPVKLRFRES